MTDSVQKAASLFGLTPETVQAAALTEAELQVAFGKVADRQAGDRWIMQRTVPAALAGFVTAGLTLPAAGTDPTLLHTAAVAIFALATAASFLVSGQSGDVFRAGAEDVKNRASENQIKAYKKEELAP